MSYVVRPFEEDDWKWVQERIPKEHQPDPRGVKSEGAYTFVCLKDGVPVGIALGRADTGGGKTCLFDYGRALNGEQVVLDLLIQRHAQNGLDRNHTHARTRVPVDDSLQCTNVAATADLTSALTSRLKISWHDGGEDAAKRAVWRHSDPIELKALLAQLADNLKGVDVRWE